MSCTCWARICAGVAEGWAGGAAGGGGIDTVTVAVAVDVPPAFVAVNVYSVVAVGVTARRPSGLTWPMPLSISTVVAFVTDQRRVADSPLVIVLGSAVK